MLYTLVIIITFIDYLFKVKSTIMFTGASNLAEGVDNTFLFIFTIAFIFIVGITAFMIYTVIHFSRKKGKKRKQFAGSMKLEVLWTLIPLILVMLMFCYGWKGFAPMRKVPADAMVYCHRQDVGVGIRLW